MQKILISWDIFSKDEQISVRIILQADISLFFHLKFKYLIKNEHGSSSFTVQIGLNETSIDYSLQIGQLS